MTDNLIRVTFLAEAIAFGVLYLWFVYGVTLGAT